MSIAYKNRRKGSKKRYQNTLLTPRSKAMKALRAAWKERRAARG